MITKDAIVARCEAIKLLAAKVAAELPGEQCETLATAVLNMDFFVSLPLCKLTLRRIMGECEIIDRIVKEHAF
jgi:hypothetical protein